MDRPNGFLLKLIDMTKEYASEVRKERVDFYWREVESGEVEAKFDFGRKATGDFIDAACLAIGNVIRAVDTAVDEETTLT